MEYSNFESLEYRRYLSRIHRQTNREVLRKFEIEEISEYLANPTKKGVWKLSAKWNPSGGISGAVWSQLTPPLEEEHHFEVQMGRRTVHITLDPKNRDEYKDFVFNRISFIFYLFHYAHLIESDSSARLELGSEEYQVILEAIDLEKILAQYMDAFNFFKDNISFEDYEYSVKKSSPYKTKTGIFFLEESIAERTQLNCLSVQKDSLQNLATLMDLVEKIETKSLRPVFSPEEVVFEPYFSYTKLLQYHIMEDDRLTPLFTKAIEDFEGRRYENSISNIGQIGEDYLTQVFETIFRNPCPKNLTLGQLFDLIHSKIYDIKRPEEPELANLNTIYSQINELSKQGRINNKDILKLVRSILNGVKRDRKYYKIKLNELSSPRAKISVFPQLVYSNINELIRNRNAASHKTRVPLGRHEALRSLYCVISSMMWWKVKLNEIDWEKSSLEIIDFLLEGASGP